MGINTKIVPDASVILKWVLPAEREPYSQQAYAISQAFYDNEIELIVPSLWVYEVGNILTLKYPEYASALMTLLTNLNIPVFHPAVRQVELATRLVARHSITFYDANYHALAITNDAIFVTADEKFLLKVRSDEHCQHLRDWN